MQQETQAVEPYTFHDRLRAAREAKGLTQAELGKGLARDGADLGKGAVSSWEVGASSPAHWQLALICNRLGVSADYLLGTDRTPANATTQPAQVGADRPGADR